VTARTWKIVSVPRTSDALTVVVMRVRDPFDVEMVGGTAVNDEKVVPPSVLVAYS
jgi:hypothetical protein